MATSSYLWRTTHLYPLVPGLKDLDLRLGVNGAYYNIIQNRENVETLYKEGLGKCSTKEQLVNFFNSKDGSRYISLLEYDIAVSNCAQCDEYFQLISQKIHLLETVRANLYQTSTRS